MRATHLLVVVLAASACKKDASSSQQAPSPRPPASTTAQDALWALAPDQAVVGAVISPQGLDRLEAGGLALDKLVAGAPELAPFKAKLDQALQEVLGTTNPSLAAAGMSSSKGLAVFAVPGEPPIVILPVTDRDKFLAVTHGQKGSDGDTIKHATCKTVQGVYACARSPELFDRLGKGDLSAPRQLVGARGDIELAAVVPGATPVTISAVAQLGRGSFVVRGAVKGVPAEARQFLVNARPRVDGDKTAGFALLNLEPYLAAIEDKLPPAPVVPGVTLDALVKTIAGPLTMTVGNGDTVIDLRLPLTDGGLAQKLISQCDTLPPVQMLGATVKEGTCHLPVPQLNMELDAWIEGNTLRIGKKGARTVASSAPLSPAAAELASGEWVFAMMGRGTMFAPTPVPVPVPPGALPPEAMMGIRAISMINELGFGVRVDGDVARLLVTARTAWSNPDDVVAKLVAITPDQILQGKAGAAARPIAEASPHAPFAADYAAGYGGLMIASATVGVLSAVAIPAYLDYMRRSRQADPNSN